MSEESVETKKKAAVKIPRSVLRLRKERPKFVRQESWRYKRLGEKWRRPRGKDSKTRLQKRGWPPLVKIGYRSPRKYRGLHPSGYREVLVHDARELEGLDPRIHAVRLSGSLGARSRLRIYEKALSMGLKVLNPPRGAEE
ncbi:MAG: 50S ribosomal protein L32e [Nitrososphaerota archaeon]|nr:50S ribosomal protein L32e [Candidatus Calditenuaceae archaeon]MDW8072657.1 50S ribosomal protein L32e [Nitrososphaerota archaeon]